MWRINVDAKLYVQRGSHSLGIRIRTTYFNHAAHHPVIESARARAIKRVGAWLIKRQGEIGDFPWHYIHAIHIHLTDCKTMNDIVGGKTQMKWFADFRFQDTRTPTAVIRHSRV